MKKRITPPTTNLSKWMLALVLTVFINLIALAQDLPPGDFGGQDDSNPLDGPTSTTPIDDYLGALVLLAIGFAFFKSRTPSKNTLKV